MRILTDEELDEVFGGNSGGLTLGTVQVRGPSYSTFNSGGFFSYGPDYSEGGGGQSGGSAGSGGGTVHYAVDPSSLPRADKMECLVAAAGEPGHVDTANVRIQIINAHAFQAPGQLYEFRAQAGENPEGFVRLRGQMYVDPNSYYSDGGMNAYTRAAALMFVDAFSPTPEGTRSHAYYNEVGEIVQEGRALGALTGEENAVMVAAHEYQHAFQARYPSMFASMSVEQREADAERYGLKALDRYRAGNKGNCN